MHVPDYIMPSLLVPEIYSPWKFEPGFIARVIADEANDGFYRSIEISQLPASDRASVRDICTEHSIRLTSWLTQVITDQNLDLTSLDEPLRLESVEVVKRSLPDAVASGASVVALVGGGDPGPGLREQGYDSFVKSMGAVCREAANLGLRVMFEPLDRFAHKKRLLGPTDEAVSAIARVRENHPTFGLAFDTAHVALNEEQMRDSIILAQTQIVNFHLANAVLDSSNPLYGDHHMPPGLPGFLELDTAARILTQVIELKIGEGLGGLPVAVEIKAQRTASRHAEAAVAREFLKSVLSRIAATP